VKPLQISELASLELTEAVRWYEERRPGWGARLFDAVSQAFDVIEQFPESGASRRSTARQLPVRGFPFLVVYRIRPDDVHVVAVAHAKRCPGYWMNRP
jgi:plasmid stabilization system protein ParE